MSGNNKCWFWGDLESTTTTTKTEIDRIGGMTDEELLRYYYGDESYNAKYF